MRAGVRGDISCSQISAHFSLTCDVDWTLSRTLYHERDALEVRTTPEEGAWSLEAWSSRSQTEPHRKHSAARCFYFYILLVKGADEELK